MCCMRLAENTGRKKSPFWHHRITLSGCIFAAKACIGNRKKKLVKQQRIVHMTPQCGNFGPIAAEIGSGICGTSANFNGFRILAALLHATLVVSVSQTLRRWTDGATYIRQGGHHVRHWPTFLVLRLVTTAEFCWPLEKRGKA